MHIEFVRSGGFAGLRLAASLDTQQLGADIASTLEKLVAEAGFFTLPEQIKPASPGPDRFEYQVTISSGAQKHSINVSDAVVPEALRPLLDFLTTLAMSGKK
jgi:Emfourin